MEKKIVDEPDVQQEHMSVSKVVADCNTHFLQE
jgi:hypothetical protein